MTSGSALRRYAALLRPRGRAYALGLALMAVTNALSLAVPWLVKVGVDGLSHGRPGGPTVAPPLGAGEALACLVAIGGLLLVIRTGSRWYLLGAGRELARDLRDRLHTAALGAPPAFHARFGTGEVVSRSTSDVGTLQMVGSGSVLYAANALFTLLLAAPWLLWIDPLLGALVLAPLPLLGAFVAAASARVRDHAQAVQEAMAGLTRTAQETLAGIEVVRSFSLEARQASRFAGHNDAILAASVRESLLRTSIGGATVVAGALSTAALVVIGGRRVAAGALTVGDLALVLTVLALVLRTTVFVGWVVSLAQRGLASLDRVEELLAAAAPLPVAGPGRTGPLEARVELRGLTLRHATAPGAAPRRPALEEVTLDVAPGRALGLTGPVGSGKSTLLQAVARLVDAPPGAVLVDGTPVERWDPAALRGGLGWVPQDGVTFSMTLAENVAFGRPDATREQVLEAVRAAALEKDLDQLPGGLEVLVGERGVTLSGGQRQRLAIARALLVRPRLLLLDDALSMVDAETAAAILRALRAALPGTTLLVAAHRTATLLGCDEVVVLDRGRVVERGPPAELLARADGRFAALHERQRLEASLEAESL